MVCLLLKNKEKTFEKIINSFWILNLLTSTEKDTFIAEPYQITFLDPVTHIMYSLIDLHHDIMFLLVYIITFVIWMISRIIFLFDSRNKDIIRTKITHNSFLEVVWTLIPTFILMIIAYPSFVLLYAMDAIKTPQLTIKIIGNQWYWTYNSSVNLMSNLPIEKLPNIISTEEYLTSWKFILPQEKLVNDNSKIYIYLLDIYRDWSKYSDNAILTIPAYHTIQFDSYMTPDSDIIDSRFRLLEVDKYSFIPMRTQIRLLVSASDVLHSWTIPAFGVKIDGCPGRQNEVPLYVFRDGTFFGQCSELCGINHGFMPIKVWVMEDYFYFWKLHKELS